MVGSDIARRKLKKREEYGYVQQPCTFSEIVTHINFHPAGSQNQKARAGNTLREHQLLTLTHIENQLIHSLGRNTKVILRKCALSTGYPLTH